MAEAPRQKSLSFLWYTSWRMLWRDWRSGELAILALGLVIAVTSITAVGFFIDRVERGLDQQSAELIGADIVITSGRQDVADYIEDARSQDFRVAMTQQFRSVLLAADRPQLVEVKAVTRDYPLRGVLRISDDAFGEDKATTGIPAPGDVWVEARLLQLVGLDVGDDINLGYSRFRIRHVLRYEPDRAGDMFSVAPRVMMNRDDVDATGLISTGALVNYRVLVSGAQREVERYARTLEGRLRQGEQILSVEEGRPELNTALERARQFLGLAALISVLLAGVAVATVAYRFASRHLDTSAMLRCLGASQHTVIRLFSLEVLWLSLLASTLGCALGLMTQYVISELLDQLILTQLPQPSLTPLLLGYATGIVMLTGFALPPLMSLGRVPPLRVLRRDSGSSSASAWLLYLTVLVCMAFLLYLQVGDYKLVAIVLGGITATLAVLALAAYGLIRLLNRLRGRVGIAWRFGLANISRRPVSSVIQIVAFGLGIMVMLLLSTVRSDLLDDWQRSLPADSPNHFIINVQPDQVEDMQDFFEGRGVMNTRLYPMVRARLVSINAIPAQSSNYESERAKHMITREFNLSWAENMQQDNRLTAGSWWDRDAFGEPLMSMEAGLAQTLGLNIDDRLGFDINGTTIEFRISSLRSVDWDTFNINFFSVVPPGVIEDYPANWVTSVYLDGDQRQSLGQLVRQFPNITLIDVDTVMQRVRGIMDRVSLAVEFIFLFTILAGLAVLYAAIQANQDERRYENAVLRTLGARKRTLLFGLLAEFTLLGALSGLLAGLSATSLAWLLALSVFKFDYTFDISVALTGLVAGIVIVVVAGMLGTRSVMTHPPIRTLRESTG
jgi:putative ABC transport system permease protein